MSSGRTLLLCFCLVKLSYNQCWPSVSCGGPAQTAFPGSWDANIFSPHSRTVSPSAVLTWPTLANQSASTSQTLTGNGSLITFDFGREVGGLVTFDWRSTGDDTLGLAFSEAKNFVGFRSDDSDGAFKGGDGALNVGPLTAGSGTYAMPLEDLRGGFRYMTVFLLSNSTSTENSTSISISSISVSLDFQPTWPNLRAYHGYFNSSDPLLNRIWYAGAYTLQTNIVPTDTGRAVPFLQTGWANNATLGPGDTIIVDGAKRDRAVWPGDMGIAVPSIFVSLGDLEPVKNALQVMCDTQNKSTGAFAESGPPLSQLGSDTYHMWSMIGTYNYFLYTNDTTFLQQNWPGYEHAMSYVLSKIDLTTGLFNVTGLRDWARLGQGGHNTEANIILYHTLTTGSQLATWLNDSSTATNWSNTASTLASAINTHLFDPAAGAFKDNDTATTLHPQDANSLALLFSLPQPPANLPAIVKALTQNWTPIGPVAPELPDNISPFITSFELLGRLAVNDTAAALQLLHTTWGWIVSNPNSTQSTLLEGYLANGSFAYRNYQGYDYDESYVSHAHGWSTGPTSALTNYVLGLDVTSPGGAEWRLAPRVGDLEFVEGGFRTGLGGYWARWEMRGDGGLVVNWTVPEGTVGTMVLSGVVSAVVRGNGGVGREVNGGSEGVRVEEGVSGERWLSVDVGGGVGNAECVRSV